MGVFIVCKLVMNNLGRQATESIPVPKVKTEEDIEEEKEQYNKARVEEGYGVMMKDYILYLTTVKDINVQKLLCKKVYDKDKKASYLCDICDKSFSLKAHLTSHIASGYFE